MAKPILALCDENQSFVKRLAERWKLRDSFPFEIHCYWGEEAYVQMKKDKAPELVVIGRNNYEALRSKHKELFETWEKERVLIVLEEENNWQEENSTSIYKYQSAEELRREVLRIYGQEKGNEITATGSHVRTKLIGVYSPIGRCLQTSFSLLLGQQLSKNRKVLYLNFEPYSGFQEMLNIPRHQDITDLIFAMGERSDKLSYHMESMIHNLNGLDYIAPAASYLDLSSISEENWIILLEALKTGSCYDYIILDLSEIMHGLLNILRVCHRIYTIQGKDGFAQSKIRQYEALLRNYEYEDVLNKTMKLEFPLFKHLPASIEELAYSELAQYIKQKIIGTDFEA